LIHFSDFITTRCLKLQNLLADFTTEEVHKLQNEF